MINKIISDCLLNSKRVVVPQFGAFIHKEGDGVVVFVSFLKKDDGVLSSLVCNSCGISQAEADEMISEYVAHVKSIVGSRGSFLIEGIGSIKVDSNGLYYLVYNPELSNTTTAGGAEASGTTVASVNVQSVSIPAPTVPPRAMQVEQQAQVTPHPVQVVEPMRPKQATPNISQPASSASQPKAKVDQRTSQMGQVSQVAQQAGQQPRPQVVPQSAMRQLRTEDRAVAKPRPNVKPKRDDDKFMIIAILAAIIAVAAIAYGLFSSDGGPDMDQIMRSVEQAKDTVIVDSK